MAYSTLSPEASSPCTDAFGNVYLNLLNPICCLLLAPKTHPAAQAKTAVSQHQFLGDVVGPQSFDAPHVSLTARNLIYGLVYDPRGELGD